jgi:superfamily II DNA/RNA helicase
MAARARTAPVAPSSPVLSLSKPTVDPGILPSSTQNTALSNVRFADFVARGRLSADLLEKLLPFDRCTEVQAATFDTILDGNDV